MAGNIFTDGEIVATFTIPEELKEKHYEKKEWGVKILKNYVSQFFGNKELDWFTGQSRSRNGSLTGTKCEIAHDGKKHTFMLVEPRGEFRNEVHISKLVEDYSKGDNVDVLDYQFDNANVIKPDESAFAVLSEIRKNLPKKKKNIGAPKKKWWRW